MMKKKPKFILRMNSRTDNAVHVELWSGVKPELYKLACDRFARTLGKLMLKAKKPLLFKLETAFGCGFACAFLLMELRPRLRLKDVRGWWTKWRFE